MAVMNKEAIVKICKANGQYRTPELNETLYLHYKGFERIDGLEEYVHARVLWLEGNAFSVIENLEHLVELRQLYLQENCLRSISGLSHLRSLVSLNLSNNFITTLEGLAGLPLKTLLVKNNRLRTADDIRHVLEVPTIETLDLTGNKLEDEGVVDIFESMPALLSLYAHQNPFCSKVKPYRKLLVGRCKKLRYLDDKPVFDDERRKVDAYMVGGLEAEREEAQRIKQEEADERERNRLAFKQLIETAKAECEEGKLPEPTEFSKMNYHPTDEDRWYTEQRKRKSTQTKEELIKDLVQCKEGHQEAKHEDPMRDIDTSDEDTQGVVVDTHGDANDDAFKGPATSSRTTPPPKHSSARVFHKADENTDRPLLWGTKAYHELWQRACSEEGRE